jgi:hypothetical protein
MSRKALSYSIICVMLTASFAITAMTIGKSKLKPVTASPQKKAVKLDMPPDPPGTIDGKVKPELIPDHVAYLAFWRFMAPQKEADKKAVLSYLKANEIQDTDIPMILATADDFQKQISVIDTEVKLLKDRDWPNPPTSTMGRLNQLQAQKEKIVMVLAKSLAARLSSEGKVKMDHLINDRIKRRIKLAPAPPQPSGPEWHASHLTH